ncbi:MAG: hypothetical protein VYB54_11270 [Pseudomonadota bacterium]|nr:hypothetical protein [Pseudomonadota bacterium]
MRIAAVLALLLAILGTATASAQEYNRIKTDIQLRNKARVVYYDFYHRYDDRWRGRLAGWTDTYADAETLAKGLAAREAGEWGFSHVIFENMKENERSSWCTDSDKDKRCRFFNITYYYTFTNATESSEGEVLSVEKMKKPLRFVRWKNRFAMVNTDACYERKVRMGAFDDVRGPDCVR